MGSTSCAAMATGSPTGPGWCPSEHAGGALLGEGREEGGGRRRRPGPVQSPPDLGSHLVRSPTWKELRPTTGLPPRRPEVSPTHSSCQAGWPVVVPGDPECPVNTLRPAPCPRKCWPAAKPRPAPPARVFRELSKSALLGSAATAPRSPNLIEQLWIRCYLPTSGQSLPPYHVQST